MASLRLAGQCTALGATAILLSAGLVLGAEPATATGSPAGAVTAAHATRAVGSAGWTQVREVPAGLTPVLMKGGAVRAPRPAKPLPPGSSAAEAGYEHQILRLVNLERARAGLRAVALDHCANAFAEKQNLVIAVAAALTHQDLYRVLSGCQARVAGENVGYGSISAAEMMKLWMASDGHRHNILRPGFTHIGVGALQTESGRWYATQVFLTRD